MARNTKKESIFDQISLTNDPMTPPVSPGGRITNVKIEEKGLDNSYIIDLIG